MLSRLWFLIFALSAIFVLLTGCVPKADLSIEAKAPAQVDLPSQYREGLAVVNFDREDGRLVAARVEAKLANILFNDKPYFTLVERAAIDKVLNEIDFGEGSTIDVETAVKIGCLVGAKTVLIGTYDFFTDDGHTQEERTDRDRCISRDSKGDCAKYAEYTVNCTHRTGKYTLIPKLVSVENGVIVPTGDDIFAESSSKSCLDPKGFEDPLKGPKQIKDELLTVTVDEFARRVAPHSYFIDVNFLGCPHLFFAKLILL